LKQIPFYNHKSHIAMQQTIMQIVLSPTGSFICVFLLMFMAGWSIHIITKRAVLRSERKKAEKLEKEIEAIKQDVREKTLISEMLSSLGDESDEAIIHGSPLPLEAETAHKA